MNLICYLCNGYPSIEKSVEMAKLYEQAGCQRCGGTGYYDRIGVYEIMEITPALRAMIARRCSTDELRQAAVSEGMRTMRESAKRLVLEGITSVSELQRISVEDQNERQDTPALRTLDSEVSA